MQALSPARRGWPRQTCPPCSAPCAAENAGVISVRSGFKVLSNRKYRKDFARSAYISAQRERAVERIFVTGNPQKLQQHMQQQQRQYAESILRKSGSQKTQRPAQQKMQEGSL